MTQSRLILASSSPRRREIVAALGIPYTIIKPEIDETQHSGEPPLDYVCRVSREKAYAVARQLAENATILSADTIVILSADTIGIDTGGEILGKPVDAKDAHQMLQRLRGRKHQVCTAITLLQGEQEHSEVTCSTVLMRDYTDAEIDSYIATGDPFDKAGSYAIQHEAFHPVSKVEGSYTNVVGLPVETLRALLNRIGWPPDPNENPK